MILNCYLLQSLLNLLKHANCELFDEEMGFVFLQYNSVIYHTVRNAQISSNTIILFFIVDMSKQFLLQNVCECDDRRMSSCQLSTIYNRLFSLSCFELNIHHCVPSTRVAVWPAVAWFRRA